MNKFLFSFEINCRLESLRKTLKESLENDSYYKRIKKQKFVTLQQKQLIESVDNILLKYSN